MSVVAYIDGSHFTESISLNAAWAAQQLNAPVELVHVLEYDSGSAAYFEDRMTSWAMPDGEAHLDRLVESDRQAISIAKDDRREILLEAAKDIRARGVERIHSTIDYGTLDEHVRDRGSRARLIVIGKRGERSAEKRGDLGSNLERAIRVSPCPVLIAPSEPRQIARYLIAFDGSAHSGNAIRYLVEQPLLKNCEGTLLLAGDHPGTRQQLYDAASHLRSAGYNIDAETGHGKPDSLIPDIMNTEDIDLLVMGAFSHSRLYGFLGRSTTLKLLRSSTKAILAVR